MGRPQPIPDWPAVLARGGRWSALVRAASRPAAVPQGGLAFLAAPYLAEVSIRAEWRADRAARMGMAIARELIRLRAHGVTAVCPVLIQDWMMTAAPLAHGLVVGQSREDWEAWARPMLHASQVLVVPDLQGWDRCPTIRAQVGWALDHNLPVHVYAGRV